MSTRPTFSISGVLLLGLVFHLVFINSVFDCYFTSHVVHGMRHFKTQTGEAKRLVLIVGGLQMITQKLPDPHVLRKQATV
jgi:phosphatidylinositol glycan class N